MVLFEKWDEEERYLKHMSVRFAGPSAILDACGSKDTPKTTRDMVDALHISLPREFLDDGALEGEEAYLFLQRIGVKLISRGIIDLAYAYAMKEVQFLPR
jgi:hypothetical protein